MLQNKKFNLIFDFDGTLVDSFYVAMQTFNLLAEEFKFNKIDMSATAELKNLTSQELIKTLKIPIYHLPRVLQRARESIRNEISVLTIFTNLPEVLNELHHLNCSLGILTSNSLENVELWLKRYNLCHLFDFIHAESSYFGKKNILKKIIKSQRMELSDTFYIGDETRDMEAAEQCKINSIAVSWGFNSAETLIRYRPNYVVKTPIELLEIIKELVSCRIPADGD